VNLWRSHRQLHQPLLLEDKRIHYIISARLTQGLQQAIVRDGRWFALATGLELAEIAYQGNSWDTARRIVVVRQSIKRKTASGKRSPCLPTTRTFKGGVMVRW